MESEERERAAEGAGENHGVTEREREKTERRETFVSFVTILLLLLSSFFLFVSSFVFLSSSSRGCGVGLPLARFGGWGVLGGCSW